MSWTLHHGDCLDPVSGLASLADKSVDHVITDPPYEAEAHELGKRQNPTRDHSKRVVDEGLDFGAISTADRTAVAAQATRLARKLIVAFCQVEAVAAWRTALQCAGAKYLRAIPWVKPDAMPSLHGRWPGQAFEVIVLASTAAAQCPVGGKAVWYSHTRTPMARDRRPHPTMKPLDLMLQILEDFTDHGETILDPFAGSGTTGVACNQLGRSFIGWERDANYHAIATRRLNGDEAKPRPEQPSLFGGAA